VDPVWDKIKEKCVWNNRGTGAVSFLYSSWTSHTLKVEAASSFETTVLNSPLNLMISFMRFLIIGLIFSSCVHRHVLLSMSSTLSICHSSFSL